MVGNTYLQEYTCIHCGRIVRDYEQRMTFDSRIQLEDSKVCFNCSFWLNAAQNPILHAQVIDDQLFSFPPVVKKGGKVRHILTIKGEMIDSTELFNYGKIPEQFKHLFPTTAHFVKCHVYRKLKTNYTCRRLGCWDRINCFWFREKNRNWNKIPKDYVPGGEHCPMYINILNPNG